MSFSFSKILIFAGIFASFGVLLYLLRRIKRDKSWMPILSVIHLPKQPLPKLKFVIPPWVSFLCFLCSAIALVFLVSMPNLLVNVEQEPGQKSTHILVDLSPSVEAHADVDALAAKAADIYFASKSSGSATLSFSHGDDILQFEDVSQLKSAILDKGIQRTGFLLADAVSKSNSSLERVDQLIILSDGSPSTWKDFNWRFFDNDTSIFWVPLSSNPEKPVNNVYFEKISSLAEVNSGKQSWQVVVRRNFVNTDLEVKVNASYNGRQLGSQAILFGPESIRSESKFVINIGEIETQVDKADLISKAIKWELEVDEPDYTPDNTFYTTRKNLGKNVYLLGAPEGESMLEDPSYQLKVIFETLGYNTRRVDFAETTTDLPDENFIVSFLGTKVLDAQRCPSIFLSKLNKSDPIKRTVWLTPTSLNANFSSICHCFKNIIEGVHTEEVPPVCSDTADRTTYIKTLKNLGARQFGGKLGSLDNAIALSFSSLAQNLTVYAFTVPLRPLPNTSLRYGSFPLLVKTLLAHKDANATESEWPRAKNYLDLPDDFPANLSNIPTVESQFDLVNISALPPALKTPAIEQRKTSFETRKKKDPKPIIEYLALLILGLLLTEILLLLVLKESVKP